MRRGPTGTTHAHLRSRLACTLVGALAAGALVATAAPAQAFGTTAGQGSEHEFITRAALACPAGTPSDGSCFEPKSLDQVAGKPGSFGGVGAPDSDEVFTPQAHCDDADFLAVAGYPQTRAAATAQLQACITHLRARFTEGVTAAAGLLKADGTLDGDAVDLSSDCTFFGGVGGRAKCEAIEGLGRALHGVQDFYSHSNWADSADPAAPVGLTNPPGLNLPAPSALLDLSGAGFAAVPANLTTGHFTLTELVVSCATIAGRTGRVTHKCLNKDTETINPVTGAVAPCPAAGAGGIQCTDRGRVGTNSAKAVAGAITETRRQWNDFRARLVAVYGAERGKRMISAITQDVPRLDLVLTIDTTGSMADDIASVQAAGAAILDSISGDDDLVDYRVALTDYKDLFADCPSDGYASRVDLGFSTASDRAAILGAINALGAAGGCDLPESVYSGIMSGIRLPWRDGVQKAVIVMGDAPAHDPEPSTGFTLASVLAAAKAVDPALIYTVEINGGAGGSFKALADGSGGKHYSAAGAGQVTTALLDAIRALRGVPVAAAGGPYSGGPGETLTFDASGSSDPDGTITDYAWDFESDGTFDTSGASPTASHAYPAAFTGQVTVRVTDDENNSALAMAPVVVGANRAPVADAGGPYSVRLGEPVTLDGSASADPDGTVVEYAWDVDGDGATDLTTSTPKMTYTYPDAFTGTVRLTVTDNQGRTASAAAPVTVSNPTGS